MSIVVARKKRTALFLSIAGLLAMVAAVSAVSAQDPDGVGLRVGMIMMTVGAALWLPWQALLPAVLIIWLGPNYTRSVLDDEALFSTPMLLELPGLVGLAGFSTLARQALRRLEEEDILLGATSEEFSGIDAATGVYEERLLRPAIEAELARARRFNHEFSLILVGIDEMRQRFDYRDQESWETSFGATARLLRSTRNHIDRAYRLGSSSFALILPESGEREVTGLIKRLRRQSRRSQPAEGEPGGPLPTHYGATFFPQCATTAEDLLRRAEVALKLAEKSSTRIQLDGAAAAEMPPPDSLRREEPELEPALDALAESAPAALVTEMESAGLVLETVPSGTAEAEETAEPVAIAALRPVAAVPAPEFAAETPQVSEEAVPAELVAEETQATPEPVSINSAAKHERTASETPADIDDLVKHLDETLAMIRSLRTGTHS